MFRNFLLIAQRNLFKNKVFSLVNILGLAIGMAACWFIFEYVRFERSYDGWHANAGRIYRVPLAFTRDLTGGGVGNANYAATGPEMKADLPEVEEFARLGDPSAFGTTGAQQFSYTDEHRNSRRFNETEFYFADASFLRMFSFPFLEGDPHTALADGKSVVISASMARKYFGDEDAMGKTLYFNSHPLIVEGVFQDVPGNSHVHFQLLISLPPDFGHSDQDAPSWYTYILLKPGTDPSRVAAKLPAFVDKHLTKRLSPLNMGAVFFLQSLTAIHLGSSFGGGYELRALRRRFIS